MMHSGDILILSGDCRLAFHGVARVFEHSSPLLFGSGAVADACELDAGRPGALDEELAFQRFISNTRVNVNVRQVAELPTDR
jgi:alkylated DNA repair protein alkB family protein 1